MYSGMYYTASLSLRAPGRQIGHSSRDDTREKREVAPLRGRESCCYTAVGRCIIYIYRYIYNLSTTWASTWGFRVSSLLGDAGACAHAHTSCKQYNLFYIVHEFQHVVFDFQVPTPPCIQPALPSCKIHMHTYIHTIHT